MELPLNAWSNRPNLFPRNLKALRLQNPNVEATVAGRACTGRCPLSNDVLKAGANETGQLEHGEGRGNGDVACRHAELPRAHAAADTASTIAARVEPVCCVAPTCCILRARGACCLYGVLYRLGCWDIPRHTDHCKTAGWVPSHHLSHCASLSIQMTLELRLLPLYTEGQCCRHAGVFSRVQTCKMLC